MQVVQRGVDRAVDEGVDAGALASANAAWRPPPFGAGVVGSVGVDTGAHAGAHDRSSFGAPKPTPALASARRGRCFDAMDPD